MEKLFFELTVDNKVFKFEVDIDGIVWLIEQPNTKSNFGQLEGVWDMTSATKFAKEMLYISGRIKNRIKT